MALSRRSFLGSAAATQLVLSTWPNDASASRKGDRSGRDLVHRFHNTLSPVPITDVEIDDRFWSPKRKIWRTVTIPDCFAKFEADRGGAFNNFDKVRQRKSGGHAGDPWMDGLVYEMIRAAADFLVSHPDPALAAQLEGYSRRIAAAADARADGYVNTYTQLVEPGHEWGENGGLLVWQHDIYNLGALVDAGIHLYRATGSTTLLVPAVRIANTMDRLMGPAPKKNLVPAHPLPEEALIRLHELFVEQPALARRLPLPVDARAYRRLAEFWIENRGKNVGQPDWEKGRPAGEQFVRDGRQGSGRPSWGAYAQDHASVFEQQSIEGHAVRATLLCAGIAAAAGVNGDPRYRAAAIRLWDNMVGRRMHITGGVGAYAEEEKFGPDFVLPNDAYLETCAAVGAGFFHHNMNLLLGEAHYVDELERVLYNGVQCGVSLEGNTYLYRNPLEGGPERARWHWHDCPCCPPMFLKMMGAMPGYIYATDADGVYVNLFVAGKATIRLEQGPIVLRQEGRYPWDGAVRVVLERTPAAPFAMMIRVPAWCEGATLRVNGEPVPATDRVRGYVRIHRAWSRNDVVELDLPMPVRQVRADPRVASNLGRAALMRGPLVYCIESLDTGGSWPIALGDATFTPRSNQDAHGATVLVAKVRTGEESADQGIYRTPAAEREIEVTAIPFFSNLNRGPTTMAVWHPIQL